LEGSAEEDRSTFELAVEMGGRVEGEDGSLYGGRKGPGSASKGKVETGLQEIKNWK